MRNLARICVVILALLMVAVPVVPMAAAQYNVELIANGGFESVNAGKTAADGWGGFRTWGNGSVLSLVSAADNADNVHSGNYAVKFETKGGDNPFFSYGVSGLYGRCKYRITFWYKIEQLGTGSNGINVKVEQNRGEYYTSSFKTTSGWKYAEHEFYMNDGTTNASIMPRTYSDGDIIYLDDISLKCIEGPDMLDMETDWVFYYENYNEGKLTVTMDPFYDGSGYTADVKITRGLAKYTNVTGLKFTNNKLEYTFDISKLAKKAEYTLAVTVKDADGAAVETIKQFIYRIDRPTNIREDGAYVCEGEIFEPILAYHFDLNDYEDALKAGVNVFQWGSPSLDAEKCLADLDDFHAKGLKAAVVCYWSMRPAGHELNEENIKKLVNIVKDHPAVFCYMVMDEPFSHANSFGGVDAMEDYLRNSYKIIRMIDDKHPVYLCEDQLKQYPVSAKYVDCMGIDPYPGDGDFGRHVGNMTQAAVAGTKGEKPVYAVVQAMSWKGVIPDGPMLRTQLYQAMMGGADIVGYYPWVPDNTEIDVNLNVSRYWDTMLSFNEKDKPLLYSYYSRGEYDEFSSYKDNDLWYDIFTDGITYYMTVLNRKSTQAEVTLSLENSKGAAIPQNYVMSVVNGGDIANATRSGNTVTAKLDAYGAVLYKFQAPLGMDVLSNGGFENITDGVPADWTGVDTWTNGSVLSVVSAEDNPANVHSGNHAIKYEVKGGDNPFICQRIDGISGGSKYRLSFWYKANIPTGGMSVKFEQFGEGGGDVYSTAFESAEEWTQATFDITLNENIDGVRIMPRAYAEGTELYIDDISFKMIGSADISTDLGDKIIAFVDENLNPVTDISQAEGDVYVYMTGFGKNEKIFITEYKESYSTLRVAGVTIGNTTVDGTGLVKVNIADKENSVIKAFIWAEGAGEKNVVTLK